MPYQGFEQVQAPAAQYPGFEPVQAAPDATQPQGAPVPPLAQGPAALPAAAGGQLPSPPAATAPQPSAPATRAAAQPSAPENFFAGLGGAVTRGTANAEIGLATLGWVLGLGDDPGLVRAVQDRMTRIAAAPQTEGYRRGAEDFEQSRGFWQSAWAIVRNPEFAANELLSSMTNLLYTAPAAVVGGAVGGPVGVAAGLGAGSAATQFGEGFWRYMAEHGVDVASPMATLLALQNPDLVGEATAAAARYSGAVGLFDAIGAGVGGRIAERFFIPEITLRGRVGAGLGAAATDALSGAIGEAAGGLWSRGQVDWRDVAAEAVLGLGPGAVETSAIGAYRALRSGRQAAAAPPPDVTSVLVPPEVPLPEVPWAEPPEPGSTIDSLSQVPSEEAAAPPVEVTPGLYSAVDEALRRRGIPQNVTGLQWLSFLRRSPNVKEQELEARGVRAVLQEVAPNQRISLDEMQRLLALHPLGLEVEERPDPFADTNASGLGGGTPRAVIFRVPDQGQPFEGGHFDQAEKLTVGWGRVEDLDGRTLLVNEIQSDIHQLAEKVGEYRKGPPPTRINEEGQLEALPSPPPVAPFAQGAWAELALKQIINFAARSGYERVALASGRLQDAIQGMANPGRAKFYDTHLKGLLAKWAKRTGARLTHESVWSEALGDMVELPMLEITEAARPEVAAAKAMFSEVGQVAGPVFFTATRGSQLIANNLDQLQKLESVVRNLARRFKIGTAIRVDLVDKPGEMVNALGEERLDLDAGAFVIRLNLQMHAQQAVRSNQPEGFIPALFATFAHEFGHVLAATRWAAAPAETQLAVQAAYNQFLMDVSGETKLQNVLNRRNNAMSLKYHLPANRAISDYWLSFEEWYAEQVAKWATTSDKPLTIVEKYFSALAKVIREAAAFVDRVLTTLGYRNLKVDSDLAAWLDSFINDAPPFAQVAEMLRNSLTRERNASEMAASGIEDAATPQTDATLGQRAMLRRSFGGTAPADLEGLPAVVDSMNWFYKTAAAIWQVAKRNPRLRQLHAYTDAINMLNRRALEGAAPGYRAMKKAQRLGPGQQLALTDLFYGYMTWKYLSEEDFNAGIRRRPNAEELQRLAKQVGAAPQAVDAFVEIVKAIDGRLAEEIALGVKVIRRTVADPEKQDERIRELQARARKYANEPYFPAALRYGEFGIVVRDAARNIVYVDFATSAAEQARLTAAAQTFFGAGFTSEGIAPGREVGPLTAMYTGLLPMYVRIGAQLNRSQKEALNWLVFEDIPPALARSRPRIRGGNARGADFFRLLGNYFYHNARFAARLEFGPQARAAMADLAELTHNVPSQQAKLRQITNMVSRHYDYVMNPKKDAAVVKSLAFHWFLGFNVASAALNLTQTIFFTWPHLASKFGDFRAMREITKAYRQKATYYKTGKLAELAKSPSEQRMLSKAVELGYITEAMAPELAGLSEGRNLSTGFGGTFWQQTVFKYSQASAMMFQLAEQVNRRTAFVAAFRLAKQKPDAKYVQEAQQGAALLAERLKNEGWNDSDARAFIAAVDVIDQTQGRYAPGDRPALFRGRAGGILFIFKSFTQQMLMQMWNNPASALRTSLLLLVAGGLMGLPGAEDLMDVIKAIAYRAFGKDFDPERELRTALVDNFGLDARGADLAMHGLAREGFGIPALLGLLGVDFLPEVDRSASIGFGRVLPLNVSAMLGPTAGQEGSLFRAVEAMGGPAFSAGFGFYRALTDAHLGFSSTKTFEALLPRAFGNIAQMMGAGAEGVERSRTGSPILAFDRSDPQQFAELVAMGLGYQPTRLARQWDQIIAKIEATAYWDTTRGILLAQLYDAVQNQDAQGREAVLSRIRAFNEGLPPEARPKAITYEVIRQSLRSRLGAAARQERGLPLSNRDILIYREIERLYPGEAIVDLQRVQ